MTRRFTDQRRRRVSVLVARSIPPPHLNPRHVRAGARWTTLLGGFSDPPNPSGTARAHDRAGPGREQPRSDHERSAAVTKYLIEPDGGRLLMSALESPEPRADPQLRFAQVAG